MASVQKMTPEEHREVYQKIAESVVAEPEQTEVKPEIDLRALRGALHLDEHFPGWAKKISLEKFDLRSAEFCVIGQAFGDYSDHVGEVLKITDLDEDSPEARKAESDHGVCVYSADNGEKEETIWDKLEASWRILIAERQGA